MKRIIIVLLSLAFLATSCSKKDSLLPSNTNGAQSFKWTYLGTTFTADGSAATNPTATTHYASISGWRGDIASPTDGFAISLPSVAVGSYTASQTRLADVPNNHEVDPFVFNVTSVEGNKVSGNFNGTYYGQPLTGTFSNVPVN